MYSYNEEQVQGILQQCSSREEIISCAVENLQDGLQEVDSLGQLENMAYWILSYIEAARRSK